MTGPRMEYEPATLREGAGADRKAADGAEATEQALRAGAIAASAFGDVGNAAMFAGQAVLVKDKQAAAAAAAAEHRNDQGARADSAATQGDQLVTDTTAIAAAAPRPAPGV